MEATASAVALAPSPSPTAARARLLPLSERHPASVVGPRKALGRFRAFAVLVAALAALVAVAITTLQSDLVLAGAAMAWLVSETAVVYLCRQLADLADARSVVKRQGVYLLGVCVGGLILDARTEALQLAGMLVALGAVAVSSAWLAERPRVRRVLGVHAGPRVLLVADRWTAHDVVADWSIGASSAPVGLCLVEGRALKSVSGVPVLGGLDQIVDLAATMNVHEVGVRLECAIDADWLRELTWSLEEIGVRVTLLTNVRHVASKRVRVSSVGDSLAMGISQARPTGLVRHLKTVVESAFAAVALVVALPVLLLCAVAIKLDSSGPAFFLQERVREGGRTFRMLKLRTMVVDAESLRPDLEPLNEVGGGLFKLRTDPRVTRVGRLLRKLSLDELPQLVNVMLGQMSLVGPRPALPSEVAAYDRRARRRLDVKPGLTGLWQVSGRSSLSWDESVSLDLEYVDNWSPSRDLKIAMSTVRAVVVREGAY